MVGHAVDRRPSCAVRGVPGYVAGDGDRGVGQILLDGATAGLLNSVDLIALGTRQLRDVANPVEVFQVQAEGLRRDFPPLKTVDPARGNLRPATTSFIGRESAVAELQTTLKVHDW